MELLIFMVFMVAGFLFFDMLSTNPSRNTNEVVKKCHEIDQTHDWTTHPVTKIGRAHV